jgi:hypothetical protein
MKMPQYNDAATQALTTAVNNDNVEDLKAAIRNGADVNHPDQFDVSPLQAAVIMNDIEMVQALLDAPGIEVNKYTKHYGTTPLSRAAEFGYEAIVNALLARDEIRIEGFGSQIPMMKALYSKTRASANIVVALLEHGDSIHEQDYYKAIELFTQQNITCELALSDNGYYYKKGFETLPALAQQQATSKTTITNSSTFSLGERRAIPPEGVPSFVQKLRVKDILNFGETSQANHKAFSNFAQLAKQTFTRLLSYERPRETTIATMNGLLCRHYHRTMVLEERAKAQNNSQPALPPQ